MLGVLFFAGASWLILSKKGRKAGKTLLLVLVGSSLLGYGSTAVSAYSGTALQATSHLTKDTVLTPAEIAGYHYVGVIEVTEETPAPSPTPEAKKGSVVVNYVTTDGTTLESVKLLTDVAVGTDYRTEEKTFDGYVFKEMQADSAATSGQVVEGTTTVTYVYRKLKYGGLALHMTIAFDFNARAMSGHYVPAGTTVNYLSEISNEQTPFYVTFQGKVIEPTSVKDGRIEYKDVTLFKVEGVEGTPIPTYDVQKDLVFHHGDKEIPANKIYDYLLPIQDKIRDRIRAQYNGAGFNNVYLSNIENQDKGGGGVINWDGTVATTFTTPIAVAPVDEL
ncbi:cell wall surface anchor family protein [Streptococcus sp. DD13]|nr:cell wall surface anchor family protein [Streptococcus sp. DD13]